MMNCRECGKPVAEIAGKVKEIRAMARANPEMDVEKAAVALGRKAEAGLRDLCTSLTRWRKCQVARHPERPPCTDDIAALFPAFGPLSGDRDFAEDQVIGGGLARLDDRAEVVIGQKKGTDTASRIARDFGPARPAGCRKAIRDPAHRSGLPVITPGDRPGAYSGKGAEGRGQGGSIARCTQKCLAFAVPVVTVVIAAGGSGGAVALVNAKRIAMLERPISAAISPEGWASILWKEVGKMRAAAAALRLTATDLQRLGMIDRVIAEPLGGAQRAPSETVAAAGKAGWAMRGALAGRKPAVLIACRRRKFPQMRAKGIAA